MGEVKSKPNPKQVFDACVGGILEGLTQKQIIKTLDISKDTLKKKLGKKGTSWKELMGKTQVDPEVKVTSKVDFPQKIIIKPGQGTVEGSKNPLLADTPHLSHLSAQNTPGQDGASLPGTLSFLKPETAALLSIAKDIPAWLAPLVMEQYTSHFKTLDKPQWFRPQVLYSKQHQITDAINDSTTQIIAITGPRRTGKSTSWYVGVHEAIYEGQRKYWGLWGATEKGAGKILNDAWRDTLTLTSTRPLHTAKTFHKLSFFNGGEIEVNATTITGSKGFKYHGVILTEFDQILHDNPDAFAAIVGILRSEPDLKLILDMNMGSGAYHLLMDKLSQEKYHGRVLVIELLTEDVSHLDAERDDLVADMMECAMGEDYVQEQLLHIETHTGDAFPAGLIIEAMNGYDEFMVSVDQKKYITILAVDPGFGHPTGIMVVGVYRGHVFELESMELRGKDTSEDRIKAMVAELGKDYGAHIICESNSGGLHWIKEWNEKYHLRANAQNFSSNQLDFSARGNMMRIVRELLEAHRVHFCSDKLRQELLIYNPDKDKNDSKGDLADAFIHAVYRAKIDYLQEDEQVAYSL